jgi:predicted AAA+ superfamily ATPase
MALKPWYKVVTPREDLRENRPLDASEFAVHLDHVRNGTAPADYKDPQRFFERTFLTKNLTELAAGVLRRLSGIKVETSAVYNLTTQFGGGKTHALTLLYHLAHGGPTAANWQGVPSILETAGLKTVPKSAVAVFVGTEFDSISGRRDKEGEPVRYTPWGEIAFQLGGEAAFAVVAKHDQERTAPSAEVIRKFLPKDTGTLILLDELLNYMGRNRKSGLTNQLYSFLQNLSEEARAQERVVVAVSLPSLLDEMTSEDESDFDRFQKLLDRLGKAMIMSVETETSEIIRRRLFEWGGLPDDGKKTAAEYGEFILDNRTLIPNWFPVDSARETFAASYPFHPALLSVFERKWQTLPRFQQTRGVLRLLALWVAHAYQAGFKGAQKDALIGMGTAPLDDPQFRSAMFEQLGGARLEVAVTTDICGKKDSHAVRLDKEAVETIKKARLHQKVATTIFFESNGGQSKAEATLPEVRLAVAEPDIDMGNIETVLETLLAGCSAEASRPASGRTGRHRHGASVKTPQELMHHASPDVRSAYTQRL